MIINIGAGHYVRADEIVAVCDAEFDLDRPGPVCVYPDNRCTVVLRNGIVLAGYLNAETIRKRWENALTQIVANVLR